MAILGKSVAEDILGLRPADEYPYGTGVAPPGHVYCVAGRPRILPRSGFMEMPRVAYNHNTISFDPSSGEAQANTVSNATSRPLRVVVALEAQGRYARGSNDMNTLGGHWTGVYELAITEYATGATAVKPLFKDLRGIALYGHVEFIAPALKVTNTLMTKASPAIPTIEPYNVRRIGSPPLLMPGRTYRFQPNVYVAPTIGAVGATMFTAPQAAIGWQVMTWPEPEPE